MKINPAGETAFAKDTRCGVSLIFFLLLDETFVAILVFFTLFVFSAFLRAIRTVMSGGVRAGRLVCVVSNYYC